MGEKWDSDVSRGPSRATHEDLPGTQRATEGAMLDLGAEWDSALLATRVAQRRKTDRPANRLS
jgi:hypothetical protein